MQKLEAILELSIGAYIPTRPIAIPVGMACDHARSDIPSSTARARVRVRGGSGNGGAW